MGTVTTGSDPEAVAIGEIVFDRFEDGFHLGGSPPNFAYHLRQMGVSVALVSAVGRDALGRQAVSTLSRAGVNVTFVQQGAEPTGTVDIALVRGEPHFTVARGSAWESIDVPADAERLRPLLLCYGPAGLASGVNRASLARLLNANPRHRLFDANLRPGLFTAEAVLFGLGEATIVKANKEEWATIRRLTSVRSPEEALKRLSLEMIAITLGGRGAELHVCGASYRVHSPAVTVADTVGAGDAFSAGLAAGVIRGAQAEETLKVAAAVGTHVVQSRGAMVELPRGLREAFTR